MTLYDEKRLERFVFSKRAYVEFNDQYERPHIPDISKKSRNYGENYGDNWQSIREKTINRDSNSCTTCGMSRTEHYQKYDSDLHVHHIKPLRSFDSPIKANKLDNLTTVCISCHGDAEIESRQNTPRRSGDTPDKSESEIWAAFAD